MTLAAFYALIPALANKHRYKVAQAAQRLGDLLLRGMAAGTAIANVEGRKDILESLKVTGTQAQFESITGP